MAASEPAHREENQKLDKDDKEVQQTAATNLVASVLNSQPSNPKTGTHADGEAVLASYAPTTAYVLKRLVRGLASGRTGARQGFSLALTLLLSQLEGITADDALLLMASFLEAPAAHKGSEARDYLLGRTFGLGAIVRSGIPATPRSKADLIDLLLDAGTLKSFLRESAAAVILELVGSDSEAEIKDILEACPPLVAALEAPIESSTPEMLMVALVLWPVLPASTLESTPLLPRGSSRPSPSFLTAVPSAETRAARAAFFTPAHLAAVLPLLTFTTANHPALHGIWPALLSFLCPVGVEAIPEPALSALWGGVVESDLLFSSSHARKYLAISIFLRLLPKLKSSNVATVLTPTLLRCLSTNLTHRNSYLHAPARKCEQALQGVLAGDDTSLTLAVNMALQRVGGAIWEKCKAGAKGATAGGEAKAQTKANGMQSMDADKLAAFAEEQVDALVAACSTPSEEEDSERAGQPSPSATAAVEAIWAVLKQPHTSQETQTRILRLLASLAFLAPGAPAPAPKAAPKRGPKTKAKPAAAQDPALESLARCSAGVEPLRPLAAARLIAAADLVSKRPAAPGSATASPLTRLVSWVDSALASGVATLTQEPQEDSAAASVAALRAALATTAGGDKGGRGRAAAFQYLALLLQIYAWADPEVLDPGVGPDLAAIAPRALAAPAANPAAEEGTAWHDTLVDVLLSLLAKPCTPLPSAPLRDAAEALFRVFAADLTATGLNDLLRVLNSAAGGPEEVLGESDREGDGEDSEGDEEDGSSDEEEEEQDSQQESEEEGSSDSSDGEEEAAAAAGPSSRGSGSGSDNDDDAMAATDADMFLMDAKLAAYFASMKRGKGGDAREAAEQLGAFKLRVVTLLDSFFKRSPTSPLVPTAGVPLLNALASAAKPSGSPVLAKRLEGLITQKLVKTKPGTAGLDGFDKEGATAAFKRALYLASRSADSVVESAARAVYILLQRAAAGKDGTAAVATAALESAAAAARDLLTSRRTRLDRSFFADLFARVPSLAPLLLPTLLKGAEAARSEFVRADSVALLQLALKGEHPGMTEALTLQVTEVQAFLLSACSSASFSKPARQAEAARTAARVVALLTQKGGKAAKGLDWDAVRTAAAAAAAASTSTVSQKAAGAYQALVDALPTEPLAAATPRKRAKKA